MKVKVPREVYEAFEHQKNLFCNLDINNQIRLFMAIPSARVHGQSKILKDYADKCPVDYIYALIHGCEPRIDTKDELAKMLKDWLDKPYVENEQVDIEEFAETIVGFFEQKT